jgi:hypothetical protein
LNHFGLFRLTFVFKKDKFLKLNIVSAARLHFQKICSEKVAFIVVSFFLQKFSLPVEINNRCSEKLLDSVFSSVFEFF